jgi:competence protein ComGC
VLGGKIQVSEMGCPRGEIMRAAFGMVGLLVVLLIGYLLYISQIREIANDKRLVHQINLAAVQSDLLSLAQAERLHCATNGRYATLEELQRSNVLNSIPGAGRSGYQYTIEVDGAAHFHITASPTDSSRIDLPTLSIDETLELSQ